MIVGDPGRNVHKIGFQKSAGDTAETMGVGISVAKIAVRKRTT